MSFQAYIDNIKAKTGKTPEDFKKLAEKKGLLKPGVKAMEIVNWLKKDFGLGHGHAMAIYAVFQSVKQPKISTEEKIGKHFSGAKSAWLKPFTGLIHNLKKLGDDITVAPTDTYLSLLRNKKKFAVIYVLTNRLDVGIKLKSGDYTDRFKKAGSWNAMVTHRVAIDTPKQIDKELMDWLSNAYRESSIKK